MAHRPTINKIFEYRNKLRVALLKEGSSCKGWRIRVSRDISRILTGSPNRIPPRLIQSYLKEPVGTHADMIAKRIAGDSSLLQEQILPNEWDGSILTMTLRCNEVVPLMRKNGNNLYKVMLEVLEGPSSGDVHTVVMIQHTLTRGAITYTAREALQRRSADAETFDLAGMCFSANIYQDEKGVKIKDVFCRSQEKEHNRSLQIKRSQGCLFDKGKRCQYCWRGIDTCSLAYHQTILPKGRCINPLCDIYGYINVSGLCVKCTLKGKQPQTKKDR